MTRSRSTIGQAVVTDPSAGRASGYVLVAASPSVAPEDAHYLTAAPQVTDYLHLAKSPGPFFSFYRLPSGAWAAVKRFVRGTRRGAYNRVVIHTLVVPPPILAGLAAEPWLLWTRCRFRPRTGGAAATPAELADRVGDPGLDQVPDLELSTEDDPRAERCALLARRCDFLRQRWGAGLLAERLRAVITVRAAGRRVLLPQGEEAEQLLAVGWSLLPEVDRLETAWTTHLSAPAGKLFLMANGPEPEKLRAELADPEQWVLPLSRTVPGAADRETGESVRALVHALVGAEVDLRQLDEGFRRYGIRLASGGQVHRWILWLRRGGRRRQDESTEAGFERDG